jgi:hypothetical protein
MDESWYSRGEHKVCHARVRAAVRTTGSAAMERTPCQPQRVRNRDKMYLHGMPARRPGRSGLSILGCLALALHSTLGRTRPREHTHT